MKISVFFGAILLALSVTGSLTAAVQSSPAEDSIKFNQANVLDVKKFALSVNRFSGSFFEALTYGKVNNAAISPLSINYLLSQLTNGANGTTKEQLESLNLEITENERHQGFHQLLRKYDSSANSGFSLASAEFIAGDQELEPAYQQITQDYYGSEIEHYSNAKQAAQKFNNWIDKNINVNTSLYEAEDFGEHPEIVLGNVGNFIGKFKIPFDTAASDFDTFWTFENMAQRVPYMYSWNKYYYGYTEGINTSWVRIPFEDEELDENYSFYFMCPDEYKDIDTIVEGVKKYYWNKTQANLTGHVGKIILTVPKVDFSSYIEDLKPYLEEIGLKAPFHKKSAEFNNVLKNGNNFKLTKLSHGSRIEVSEEGLQLSFASKIIGRALGESGLPSKQNYGSSSSEVQDETTQAPDESKPTLNQSNESNDSNDESEEEESANDNSPANALPIEFRIDRPFIMTLYDNKSGLLVHISHVFATLGNPKLKVKLHKKN